MPMIAFTSCSGSPGVTSLVLSLAGCWPRPAVLVEADVDGGHLAARCGLSVRPGLVDLAAVSRSGHIGLRELNRVAQRSSDGAQLVVAHPAPEQVQSLLLSSAESMAGALRGLRGIDVLVDVGRLRSQAGSRPLMAAAHEVVIVTGTRVEDVAAIVHRAALLEGMPTSTAIHLIVTAPGEHSADDVARAVHLPLTAVRPGRSARRTSDRGRHRHADWIRHVALDLAHRLAERTRVEEADVASDPSRELGGRGSLIVDGHVFAEPSGPPLPGPSVPTVLRPSIQEVVG